MYFRRFGLSLLLVLVPVTAIAADSKATKSSSSVSKAKVADAKVAAKKKAPAPKRKPAPTPDATVSVTEPPAPDVAVVAAPAADSGSNDTAELRAELAAMHAELLGLRADVARVLPPPPEAAPAEPAPAPDPEKEARRSALQTELSAVAEQRALLDGAVSSGLDAQLAESARAALDRRESHANADLAALDVVPEDPAAASQAAAPAPARSSWTFDAGFASAYAFRGANVFAASSAQDPNALFAPSATVGLGDSGVSLGWWGGYQLSGDNQVALVSAGYGAENDLFVSWGTKVSDRVAVGAAFTSFLYPFATEAAAGTDFPVYLEPSASITWSPGVDLGMQVAYTFGAQEALAATGRYVYVHPTVAKVVELPAGFGLGVGAGAGFKAFTGPAEVTDNVWDASADLTVTKSFDGGFYVKPGAHAVWTNREDQTFAESSFAWFGVNAGVAI